MIPQNRRVKRSPSRDVLESHPSEDATSDLNSRQEIAAETKSTSRFANLHSLAKDALGLALVIGTSVGAAYGAEHYVTTSPRFAVSDLIVTGNHLRSKEELFAKAGIHEGDNVFAIDLDQAQNKLASDPWIAEATLARRLPDAIVLSVREREASAIVSLGGETFLATKEGELFKKLEVGDPSDMAIVTGIEGDTAAKDRDGASKSIARALDLASDYEHSSLGSKLPLEEIHLNAAGGVTLILGKNAAQLVLGEAPYRRKLEEAARVVSEIERRGNKVDAIFLDNDARPERVVARVK